MANKEKIQNKSTIKKFAENLSAIVQWNVRGLNKNILEAKILLHELNPLIACFQETKLSPSDTIKNIGNFKLHRKDLITNSIAHGGVAIAVNAVVPHYSIPINTELQALAIRIEMMDKSITICNIYLNPNEPISNADLSTLANQLPPPYVIVGDFNSHHTFWGSRCSDHRGNKIMKFIEFENLCLLNSGDATYHNVANNSFSAIDLSLCSPSLFQGFSWETHSSTLSSDHFPIVIKFTKTPIVSVRPPSWKIENADWNKFNSSLDLSKIQFGNQTCTESIEVLNSEILQAAKKSIPLKGSKPKRMPVPWWNEACKNSLKARNIAFNIFKKNPITKNLIAYKKARAHARRTIIKAKQNSWRDYISRINRFTPTTDIWKKIQKISGRYSLPSPPVILQNSSNVYLPRETAECLASHYSSSFKILNRSDKFLETKAYLDNQVFNFSTDTELNYNLPFTLNELQSALSKCSGKSVGPDRIHNEMLKQLSVDNKSTLLKIFNNIWRKGDFPKQWNHAIIIPILKPDKDSSKPESYRPIALTSCVCKILERMVNNRLIWFLETNNLLSKEQSGFRKNRSTIDNLVLLDTEIRNSFLRRQHLVAVFFDIEKAYDSTWRKFILKKIHDIGIRGPMAFFIDNFLEFRSFQVRINNSLSSCYTQEEGVPQGSVISVTLFLLALNDIVECLPKEIGRSLFVDDLAIWCRSSSMPHVNRLLQISINNLIKWGHSTGFKFSSTKTVAVHFCRKRNPHPDPTLILDQIPISFKDSTKFLGITLDRRLTYVPHLQDTKDRCLKAMNILKVISRTRFGGDRKTLLLLHHGLILSKLEYGCQAYGCASESTLQILNTVHHQGIRLSTGAFRTSPIPSLLVDANETTLSHRRILISVKYLLKLKQNPKNPTYKSTFENPVAKFYRKHPRFSKPLGIEYNDILAEMEIDLDAVIQPKPHNSAPWTLSAVSCNLQLSNFRKKSAPPLLYCQEFYRIKELLYSDHCCIYTDGSKSEKGTGSSAFFDLTCKSLSLPQAASVYSAELSAIKLALIEISKDNRSKFLILSDSMSSLIALQAHDVRHPLVSDIKNAVHELTSRGKSISFMWIPGHVGILGNEIADRLARSASRKKETDIQIPYSDFHHQVKTFLTDLRQNYWDSSPQNKLKEIKPKIAHWESSHCSNRREEVTLCRLRIGHTYSSHSHLFKNLEPPSCIDCNENLTVKHVLTECRKFSAVREKYFGAPSGNNTSLSKLIGNPPCVETKSIIKYLDEIGFDVIFKGHRNVSS